jgi:hypothetical protein
MFAGAGTNLIAALKNTVLPAMKSTVIKAKFKCTRDEKAIYVANIFAPRTPLVSGIPSIVNIDKNNICNIIVENCAPYDVTLEQDDIKQKQTTLFHSQMILSHPFAKTSTTAFQK